MTKDELEQRVNEARAKNLDGTVSRKWHDTVEYALRIEILRLREALRKAERHLLKLVASGQGHDGKWHEVKVCQVCGATIKTPGKGHREDCAFYVM